MNSFGQNLYFELKKRPNLGKITLKYGKTRIFENSIGRSCRKKIADLWPEGPLNSKVCPKIFLSEKTKN